MTRDVHVTSANPSEQADKLQTIIKAAKLDEVEPIWATLFAKVVG